MWGEIVNIPLMYHELNVNFIDSAEIAGWHWFRVMADPHEPFGWTSRPCRVMRLRRETPLEA